MKNKLSQLHQLVIDRYSEEELRTLCFNLSVDYDSLPAQGKAGRARELLLYLGRQRQFDRLLATLAQNRPDLADALPPSGDADALEALYAALPSFEDTSLPEPPAPGEPPFKGLQYFDQADAHLFFGRETLTARLVGRLRERPFLAVVGASGSGKSSVARAGLVPALRCGEPLAGGTPPPEGCADWPVHVITPTAHPLESLAASLTRDSESVTATATLIDDLAQDPRSLHLYVRKILSRAPSPVGAGEGQGGGRLLLLVDQFEELFTLCHDPVERQAFVDNLLTAVAQDMETPTVLVVTLRADFYPHCGQYDGLRDALEACQAYIGPMSEEELRRAIEEPATQNGWAFEPGLVDLMLRDVGDEPGALPLLSHALLETWKRRQGRTLTLAGYHEAGRVQGAIAKTAESVFRQRLTPEQQPIARAIFLRLTELGEGTLDTRRRADLAELVPRPEDTPQVEAVLKTLADARLVTTSEGAVEVAHEALIREWPRLRGWLDENRESLRLHRHLTEAAQDWLELDRDSGELYRGARLSRALEWARDHTDELNPLEREFLNASRASVEETEREREAARQRELEAAQKLAAAQQRRAEAVRRALIGVLALLLVAVGATVFAVVKQGEAQNNAKQAQASQVEAERLARVGRARELAARAQAADDSTGSLNLMLAREAVLTTWLTDTDVITQPFVTKEAVAALHFAVYKAQGLPWRMTLPWRRRHTGSVESVAYSPDGTRIVSGGADGTVRVWDAESGQELHQLIGHSGGVRSVAYSPDGTRIVSGGYDQTVRVWQLSSSAGDAESWQELHQLTGHTDRVRSVAYSPDGTRIVSGGADQTVRVWDISAALNTGAGSWQELHQLTGHSGSVLSVAYSPDGTRIVSGGEDGTVRVWDISAALNTGAESGQELHQLTGHTDWVSSVAYSPDGTRIVSGSADGTVRVWDISAALNTGAGSGQELHQLTDHFGSVLSVAYSPDGTRIVSGGADGTVRVWDAESGQELHQLTDRIDWVLSMAYSPDGTRIVSGGEDGTVRVWQLSSSAGDAESGQELHQLTGHSGGVSSVAYSPDGARIVSGGEDGTVRVWQLSSSAGDAGSWQELHQLTGHSGGVWSVAYSPDGTRIVSGGEDGTVRVWDISAALNTGAGSGQELTQLTGHSGGVWSVAYSPDGTRIVSGGEDGTVRLWYGDIEYLLNLADSLIQRDPPIFQGAERARFGFDEQPARDH